MTKYVLMWAFGYRMSIKIESKVFGSEEVLRDHLKHECYLSEPDIELLLQDGEYEDCDGEEPVSYKIQVVA